MADNNKAVGPLAAAKLVALIKAETAKKYDKAGGKIEGSAEITGGLKVGSSSEFSSSINASGEISSDMLLMAPIVALYDPAKEESISFGVSGENAAKVTSSVSGGGVQYARLAVGSPTGDNDATPKAYVDAKVGTTVYVDFWPTSSEEVYDKDFKAYLVELAASQTFDAIFDSIKAGNKTIARFYSDESKSKLLASSDDATIGGDKALGTIHFQFISAGANNVAGFSFIGEAITLIKTSSSTGIYLVAGETTLPVPNPDGTDNGKVPTVVGKKWELNSQPSAAPVDTAMSDTSTNAVQNKVIKKYVDDHAADAVRYTAQTLTFEQKQRARKNIEAADSVAPTITGTVSLCPDHITDSNGAVHVKPTKTSDDDYTITLDCGPENWPVRVAGIRTPTDAQTDYVANVAYVKAKIAEVAASGGVDVDNALSATSTNPVQNKVITSALTKKAGTAVATESANGLMSAADKKKLDGIAAGATKITIDSAMSGSSNNPVANHVVKQYVEDKVAAAGSNITVDATLSSTSANPVQNKAVKAAIDAKADKTALDSKADKSALNAKADKTALDGKLSTSGGALTGNLTGKYITGTWLQTTEATDLGRVPGKIAVLDDSGWVYHRTPAELLADIGAATVSAMLDKAYPVGSIYMSVNSTNPKTLFGGTWVQIKDRFLLAAGTTYKAGATGGEATHTLTTSEMPSHNHAVYTPNDGAADHSAPGNYPDGTYDSTYYAVGSYTSSVGNGGAHNNMPPYLSVYVWKRTA